MYARNMLVQRGARRTRAAGDAATDPSDFTAPRANGAWWVVLAGGQMYRCETSGLSFIRELQEALSSAPSRMTYDGHEVDGSMMTVDGRWGQTTSRVLWAELDRIGAPAIMKAVVATSARAHTIIPNTLKSAIYYLHNTARGGAPAARSMDDIRLPVDTRPPAWVVAPPFPLDGAAHGISCVLQIEALPPPTSTPVPTAPTNTPGVDIPAPGPEPLPPDVSDDIRRPSGLEPTSLANVPWGAVAAVGVFVAGAWWLSRGSRRR